MRYPHCALTCIEIDWDLLLYLVLIFSLAERFIVLPSLFLHWSSPLSNGNEDIAREILEEDLESGQSRCDQHYVSWLHGCLPVVCLLYVHCMSIATISIAEANIVGAHSRFPEGLPIVVR